MNLRQQERAGGEHQRRRHARCTSGQALADDRDREPGSRRALTPNASAPRASAGRSVPRYSSQERTIKVSWPHAAITARNDMALKMTASVPKACGSMLRAASANIAKPRIEPVNLIASAAALPQSTSLLGMKLAMVRVVVKGHH
jgi:hypothetical protein